MKSLFYNILLFVSIMIFCKQVYAKDYSSWINACEPYRDVVEQILDNEKVSKDFYYLMVAESRCTINAVSSKGAQGFWQLMPQTASHYGCTSPDNLECSTKAAARYLRKLSRQFKSFDDVIAAYNMGGHNYSTKGMSNEAYWLIKRVNGIKQQDRSEKCQKE